MSEREQQEHLGQLLVEERQLSRTQACLESKIYRIYETIKETVSLKDGLFLACVANFPGYHQKFTEVGGGDLPRFMKEYEETLLRLSELRNQIKAIDGPERS